MTQATLLIVDGSSYLFRAYYGMPPLTAPDGSPTGAIYGALTMLHNLIAEVAAQHLAIVFDPKGKTQRHHLYPLYKANRTEAPEDLICQIQPLQTIIRALGLPLLIMDGIEADDVIGTLARQASTQHQLKVLIASNDKDLAQLVNPNISLLNPVTNQRLGPQDILDKFGVPPEQIIDYLALTGDSADNIPGVPKVGPKTAVKWINAFGNTTAIQAAAEKITGKVGESLRDHMDQLLLSKALVTLDLNVPISPSLEELTVKQPDQATLQPWYQRFNFKKWLIEPETVEPETTYETILNNAVWQRWLNALTNATTFALDTETTGLDPMTAELVGMSFAITPHEAAYLPLAHDYPDAPAQLDREQIISALNSLLQDSNKIIIGQNLKYDLHILRRYGIHCQAKLQDTMLMAYVLDSNGRHDLDSLAKKYLHRKTTSFESIAGKGVNARTFNQISLDTASHYAAEDADITLQLAQHLNEKLHSQPELNKVFQQIENPLLPILLAMEGHGVLVDIKQLEQQSQELSATITTLEEKIHTAAGGPFNVNSTLQLRELLFETLKLPVQQKTPKGLPSTAEPALRALSTAHPIIDWLLNHRHLSKLKSTYTDSLPQQRLARTGRIHCSYHQTGTATGRLSSNHPNLQNIPIRTAEGRRIRQAFIAPKNHTLVSADYSQIELRIMAHFSQDPGLLKAFQNNQDIHTATAAEVLGLAIDQVTTEQRRQAKTINFGLIYGMSAFGLAKQLKLTRKEAQHYIDTYFQRYPGVKAYIENVLNDARKQGYVTTLYGRQLSLPEINAKAAPRRQAAERAAINAPMQGTAADIIKQAMINIAHWLNKTKLPATMMLQVHDELIFEVNNDCLTTFNNGLITQMTNIPGLSIPLVVNIGTGKNWDTAH